MNKSHANKGAHSAMTSESSQLNLGLELHLSLFSGELRFRPLLDPKFLLLQSQLHGGAYGVVDLRAPVVTTPLVERLVDPTLGSTMACKKTYRAGFCTHLIDEGVEEGHSIFGELELLPLLNLATKDLPPEMRSCRPKVWNLWLDDDFGFELSRFPLTRAPVVCSYAALIDV